MGPTPVYGARAEKPLQNADFAMKQTNICRLSGDITKKQRNKEIDRKQYPVPRSIGDGVIKPSLTNKLAFIYLFCLSFGDCKFLITGSTKFDT